MKQIPRYIREIAKGLRNNMTPAEVRLWARIKDQQIWIKFLRQKPLYMFTEDSGLERYIIPDFYCSEKQIVIEVDGGVHNNTEVLLLDKEKEQLLNQQWIKVIRIINQKVLENTDSCILFIQNQVTQLSLWKREYPEGGRDYYPRDNGEGLVTRCSWANPQNELYLKYHDTEWGVAVYNDRVLFEFLILEWAQAGLSWETVLKKRENYRAAFDEFDYERIAKYSEDKVQELLQNEWIIRNKLKVRSAVKNAQVFMEIREEYESFSDYLWSYVDGKKVVNNPKSISEVPATSELSDSISKDLKKRGMSFVGTTIMYAYLQAVWVVDDHTVDCFCKK